LHWRSCSEVAAVVHSSPARRAGDQWCCGPWAAGPLRTLLLIEHIVAAGDQANSIGPLWSPDPFSDGDCAWLCRAVPLGARVPTGQVPSAPWHLGARCQVPTWHSCTKWRCPARGGKERHHPAQPDPSPEWPHLSKAARQATLAAFPVSLSQLGRLWLRLTRPGHGASPRWSAADRSQLAKSLPVQTLPNQAPTSKLAVVPRAAQCDTGMQTTALLCFSVFGRTIQQSTE
jgi:hypothetical protein